MGEKKYTKDGFLIVSELYRCPFWEEDPKPHTLCCSNDCFYCKFADFRKTEYIKQLEKLPQKGALYSVCHNEHNKKFAI